jgi:hypothetical protein
MSFTELLELNSTSLNSVLGAHTAELTSGPDDNGKNLPFAMETQKREEWCWAAVSVSVARFYDNATEWRQCSLVSEELGVATCCENVAPQECNQPWYLENGLDRVGHFSQKIDASVSFADLMQEIDQERPVGCWVRWPDGTGHFVVVNGYAQDFSVAPTAEYVSIRDPRYGNADYPYLKFLTAYRKVGTWSLSYLTH